MLRLKREFFQTLMKHAQELFPYECCGVLVGRVKEGEKIITEVCQSTNIVVGQREDWFEIDPEELMKIFQRVAEEEKDVLGFYHSHPNGSPIPSRSDLEQVSWSFYSYVIVSSNNKGEGDIKSWVFNEDKGEFEEEKVVWD